EEFTLDDLVRRHGIKWLALYGSALREDFGPDSDIDILVEFLPGHTPGLLGLARIELEFEAAIGREVELRTPGDLSHRFRERVVSAARPIYAA
ncbi:MAG: nucleotidyltransferase family protein, partial [Dermatophilaceae bacterium]